ncbi:3-hydroxypropanoate dehydrogenase protein [Marine Group I thaumarchaeote SCGC AAA799-E16]|uniref:3-hydroxypropanoate dehydrogenase protein n=4 Tax=Marine Group I TaxID=905826 RepID=A0A081RMW4_9ARCH|nr:3-hydroxypropanoate dehydrogenase protein [Marine Group I thaumarchaeote SCGC AAA799-N04]KER05468.1 3-hydroxypropanoate dehydrogenase protein [Marine Group I thaumarchaeote SCGC AAA799-E16]KFM15589.1 3-hydroxypropanoate dehydrogenase protein [Marine Group I thaumarchaeote SCGC AAA799-D11]KFM16788.1 putative NADH nitroreductase YdgI protein [Marine Group I thaumarchaeote SCGC RSA3]
MDFEKQTHQSNFNINLNILNRWSPRSMTGEEIPHEDLMALFEAARWAPSAFNNQPWRFIYAKRNSPEWDRLFGLLVEFNQTWAKDAAVLVVVISRSKAEHKEADYPTHAFDTGSAWENLAIEAVSRGLVTHAMAGFDYEKARSELEIPDVFEVMAMFAIGKQGPKESLPQELQEREKPADRKELSEIMMEGKFKK